MRLLVTGCDGYIGPVLTAMAQARGHHVTGLDTGWFRADGVAGPEPDRRIVRDLRDATAPDVEGAQAVIHLAALSNDPLGALAPALTDAINHHATLRLAELAGAAGAARFVYASSCSLYGAAGGDAALDETAPIAPVSAYARSKADAEAGLLAMAGPGFSPVLMRNATAFGLGPRPRFDLVVNNLAGWAHATGALRVISDGTPWRPLVHIEDIADAALCAATAPREAVHAQAFNVGRADANHTVRGIAAAVGAAFPAARLEVTGETGGDPRSYRVDFGKALAALPGFAPRWTLEMGVEEVARWIADGGLGADDFRSPRFVRLARLRQAMEAGELDAQLRPLS